MFARPGHARLEFGDALSLVRVPSPAPCPSRLLDFATPDDRPFTLISGAGDPALSSWSYAALEPFDRAATAEEAQVKAARLLPGARPFHPPFSGGAVGFLGYDAGLARALRRPLVRRDPLNLPCSHFSLYDAIYARDERTLEGYLVAQPTGEAELRMERLRRALLASPPEPTRGWASILEPAIQKETHSARIEQALELIRAGEIYQVNLTYPLVGRYTGDPRAAFRRLLDRSPPPFSALLTPSAENTIVSASPECFFVFEATTRQLTTYPIKGTRRRDLDLARDTALAQELRSSVKDRAEHVMIVDLLRNDVGSISKIGSVSVPKAAYVESFAGVHHLTSQIVGEVAPEVRLEGILQALFPGGSITGAPKLRAMEIIDALEGEARGVYTGAIGWISPEGSARFSIAIRTASIAQGEVRFGVGGGIVADSVAELEWDETEVKARALRAALEDA